MGTQHFRRRPTRRVLAAGFAVGVLGCGLAASAQASNTDPLAPGNLLVSRTVYEGYPGLVAPGTTQLPPGCTGKNCVTANADGTFPTVFNNNLVDGSFGITSPIFLDELKSNGTKINSIEVPNSSQTGTSTTDDQLVTSFSSKSELALNLSTSGRSVTFMGYVAPVNALDVSNSNTPGVIDPTNPVPGAYYRAVGQLDSTGHFHFTETNAYSGNNGRAAILNDGSDGTGPNVLYMAGNAGNGSNPQPNGIILGAGAQIASLQAGPESAQSVGQPLPLGSFNITQIPGNSKPDKIGKDTNFRGLTVFNNVVYFTKGSGGNGINTVYFIDTTGKACPGTGVGVPQPGAKLPTSPIAYDPNQLQTAGVVPYNMCVLKGFSTTLANSTTSPVMYPFGIWFANPDTLYVADEGSGDNTYANGKYTAAAAQTTAGLQKWTFDGSQWKLAYTLQSGLNLGQPYRVAGYPFPGQPNATNPANKNLPWAPATDGLRNITGKVNPNGTVTIYAITSTVSGSGDQGADPNKLVDITDQASAVSAPALEHFTTLRSAGYGEVLRGVSFTPGSVATAARSNWR